MAECDECGAPERDGLTCREQWDELLALEFSDVRAGGVHFLTVACYQLQHPQAFVLHPDGRRSLEHALAEVVVHGRPVSAVRDDMQRVHEGSRRVLGPPGALALPAQWSLTVADVGPPDAAHHVEGVLAWAKAVHEDITAR